MHDDPSEIRRAWRELSDAERYDECVELLEAAVEAHPGDVELRHLLAGSLFSADRPDDAREVLDEAVALAPRDPELLTRAASTYFYLGELEAARRCADAAASLAPRRFVFKAELKALRRNIAERLKHEEAEQTMLLAFEHGPHVAGTGESLARLYAEQGRSYAAYGIVVDALRHRPNDARLQRLRTDLASRVPARARAELEAE